MRRPGHSLTLKTLLMKRNLVELPASSNSASLLFAALDMAEERPGGLGGLNKEIKQLKPVQFSPVANFCPLSPPAHREVECLIFFLIKCFLISFFNFSPEGVHNQTMFFHR